MKYPSSALTLAIFLNCIDAVPAVSTQAPASDNKQFQANQFSANNQFQNQWNQPNQNQQFNTFTVPNNPNLPNNSGNTASNQQNAFSNLPNGLIPSGNINGPLKTQPLAQPNTQFNPNNFQGANINPASMTATSIYIQTAKSLMSQMIANPTKQFNISPILKLPVSNPLQLAKEIASLMRPQINQQQQFNFNDALIAMSFLDQLKAKNGIFSFNELLSTFIDFFSTNSKIYDKVLNNAVAIAQQNPGLIQSGAKMATTFQNSLNPVNNQQFLSALTQYQRAYPNQWAKGRGLVYKALSAVPLITGQSSNLPMAGSGNSPVRQGQY